MPCESRLVFLKQAQLAGNAQQWTVHIVLIQQHASRWDVCVRVGMISAAHGDDDDVSGTLASCGS